MSESKLKASQLLYLVFKRLRPAIGCAGYVLIAASVAGTYSLPLLLFTLSFALAYVAGDVYNDYTDYDEDVRNERTDKLTVSGVVSPEGMRNISFIVLGAALLLVVSNPLAFAFNLLAAMMFFAYSDQRIRLKKYTIWGYLAFASIFPFLPFVVPAAFGGSPQFSAAAAVAVFLFGQIVYILCQKDSTDRKDNTNLFMRHGHATGTALCALFALMSALPLIWLSLGSLPLLLVSGGNLALKALNVSQIATGAVRSMRSRIMLFEHLTPLAFVGVFLWV